jgi:FkbH-like protein
MTKDLEIAYIRNYTVEPIARAVEECAPQIGLSIKSRLGAFDNIGPEIAALASSGQAPPVVVISIDLEYFSGGLFAAKWSRAQMLDDFKLLLAAVDAVPADAFVLLSTFVPPFRSPLPWAPEHPLLGRSAAAFELNTLLRDFVTRRPNFRGILDFERIAARLGEAGTLDKRFGLMMKAPFKQDFVNAAAQEILRFLKCRYLPAKKVLVLDCDNTLWGGVVGEVGVENIHLDPYEYPGIAYYRFQSEVVALAEKGVLLCLCSKNDEPSVWQVLDHHPHCLLTRNKLAGYRINWTDKATNIRDLALELNLGLDSMVFIDDDPAECQLVRKQLPDVTVIQVPEKIYEHPGALAASTLFDRLSVTREDAERVQYYQGESGRRELQKLHVDAQSFLKDLEMKAAIRPVQQADIARTAQLCQRTNQFNLTTKRYTEADVATFLGSPDVKMFLLQAEDRYGPIGKSGLIIWRKSRAAAEVDTLLMSCRIIGRQLDRALFCQSLNLVRQTWPFDEIRATFIPTLKNGVVAGLLRDYGFSRLESSGGEKYACAVGNLKVSFPEVVQLVDTL